MQRTGSRPEYVGLLIHVARGRIRQATLSRVRRSKLAVQQFWFLVNLQEGRGSTQAEISERMHVDAPTASRIVAGLVRRRLVRAKADPRDRRRATLVLTEAGEKLARDLVAVAGELRSAVVEGMSQAEEDALRRGLLRVIANMDRFEARPGRAGPRRTA